jgi:hypothetical protein
VFAQSHFAPCVAFCGEPPGSAQAVPRAEIAAAHFAAAFGQARAAHVRRLCVYADCSLVLCGLLQGKQHCLQSPGLLSAWGPVWHTLEGIGGGPSLRVMPVKVKTYIDEAP